MKENMLRWLGVVCLVILLTSCTTQVSRVEKKIESLESLEKVEIGYKKHLAYLPLFIGLEKGFFTEEKLEMILQAPPCRTIILSEGFLLPVFHSR